MDNIATAGSMPSQSQNDITNLLNSSPSLNLSMMGGLLMPEIPAPPAAYFNKFCGDPGFAERAARMSSFNGRHYPGLPAIGKLPLPTLVPAPATSNGEFGSAREESSVSDPALAARDANSRKRKAGAKCKGKEPSLSNSFKEREENDSDAKRSKTAEGERNEVDSVKPKVEQNGSEIAIEDGGQKKSKGKRSKPVEPPKDYVHVRARRGQATDSHSLAERVRRERISQRMKVLQDLVPGCNKVIGKALMLDEIINYVQALQRQVEFLSMKLATLNPQLDFNNLPALLQKDMYQACGPSANLAFPLDGSGAALPYSDQTQQGDPFHSFVSTGLERQCSLTPLDLALSQTGNSHYALSNGSTNAPLQQMNFWEDDLQNVFHTVNGQSQDNGICADSFHGQLQAGHMKIEF